MNDFEFVAVKFPGRNPGTFKYRVGWMKGTFNPGRVVLYTVRYVDENGGIAYLEPVTFPMEGAFFKVLEEPNANKW